MLHIIKIRFTHQILFTLLQTFVIVHFLHTSLFENEFGIFKLLCFKIINIHVWAGFMYSSLFISKTHLFFGHKFIFCIIFNKFFPKSVISKTPTTQIHTYIPNTLHIYLSNILNIFVARN